MKRLGKWLKKYFIPHEGNDYRAHFLRHESVVFFFFVIIVIELGFLVQTLVVFDKTKFLAAVLPGVLTNLTNEARAESNLPLLSENPLLDEAARLKAEDMAAKGYFAHTSPDGITPWSWLSKVGYRYSAAGENLAVNFVDSEDVAQAWMNSPTHRANILKNEFTEIGIGVASGTYQGRNTIFVAQFFGKPALAVVALPTPQAAPAPVSVPTPTPAPAPTVAPSSAGNVEILGEEAVSPVKPKLAPNQIRTSLEKTLTSPRQTVNYIYLLIALVVALALVLTFFIRAEKRHPAALVRGVALFAVVMALLFVNLRVHTVYRTLVPSDLSANVIVVLP